MVSIKKQISMNKQVLECITEFLEKTNNQPCPIIPKSNLIIEFDLDGYDLDKLGEALEKKFSVCIDNFTVENWETANDVIETVCKLVRKQ